MIYIYVNVISGWYCSVTSFVSFSARFKRDLNSPYEFKCSNKINAAAGAVDPKSKHIVHWTAIGDRGYIL